MFDDLHDLYQETIMDRGREPRHMHRLDPFDATARGDNPMCGDRVQVWVRHDRDGRIAETGFEARGCAICIASADLMADAVAGRAPDEVHALAAAFGDLVRTGGTDSDDPVLDTLKPLSGVSEYPSRIKCATLPWNALVAALDGTKETTSE